MRQGSRIFTVVGLAVVVGWLGCAEPVPVSDVDWPQWRGPDRSGVSGDSGLLQKWPDGGPRLIWTATGAGSGFSSFSMRDGRLYTLGKKLGAEYVVAFDLRDGREVWATETGPSYQNDKGGGPRSTPTLDGDRLYALGASGDLWCLSAGDGTSQWHVNILDEYGDGENTKWGISESPLIDGDNVLVMSGGAGGSIVALNKNDGSLVWRSEGLTDGPGYASGLIETVGGVRQLLHFTDSAAVGVRAADGQLLWRYDKVANDTANCTTPVYHDGLVFFTSYYDTGAALLRLTSSGTETSAEEVYFTRDMMNHHGGVVLLDGYVYGFSGKNLTCMNFETGERMWRDKSVGKGSVTAADGMLYALSEKGVVGLIKATPEGYQEVSRFEIKTRGRRTWAYPVVVGGRMYIRNRDEIYCYDVSA